MKRLKYLLVICAMLIIQLATANTSYAASDYDDVISNASQLRLSYPGYDNMDISATYMGYIQGTITDGVAYNDCDLTCKGIVNDSLDHGDWSINQVYSNYPSDNYNVYVQFCDQKMTSTAFATQYWGSTRYDALRASSTIPATCAWITIQFQHVTSGGHIFIGSNVSSGITDGILTVASTAKNGSGIMQFSTRPFVYTGVFNPSEGESYEGEIPSAEAPKVKYVAMGDSFSSGEGNYPFEYGTDIAGVNECHRSYQAYPRLLEFNSSLNLGSTAFVACSGATTDDVINGKYNEPPQINSLNPTTKAVTMTIGGNNIDFKGFAHACVITSCAIGSGAYNTSWSILTNSSNSGYLPDKLDALFAAMQSKLTSSNTNANILIVGYPYVAKDDSWTPSCPYFSSSSAEGAEAIVEKLNQVIDDAVTRLGDARFRFVDASESSSPFTNHELCTDFGYFYGVDTNHIEYTFHPNVNGQAAYSEVVSEFLN